jgi:MFS family permease
LGNAVAAPVWGKIADRHGHRPVMRLCAWMKPAICLVFLLVTPATAVLVLSVSFFLDGILNSGMEISVNGFMLKLAPRENRSMFIAAICALSGVASGLGAVLGGIFLEATQSFSFAFLGRTWNHYHLIFLLSFLLRIPAIRMAGMVREPASGRSTVVLSELMSLWPMKALTFPVGLYRRWWPSQNEE